MGSPCWRPVKLSLGRKTLRFGVGCVALFPLETVVLPPVSICPSFLSLPEVLSPNTRIGDWLLLAVFLPGTNTCSLRRDHSGLVYYIFPRASMNTGLVSNCWVNEFIRWRGLETQAIGCGKTWGLGNIPWPLKSCVVLTKMLNPSEPQASYLLSYTIFVTENKGTHTKPHKLREGQHGWPY